jgi:hypothetical protein
MSSTLWDPELHWSPPLFPILFQTAAVPSYRVSLRSVSAPNNCEKRILASSCRSHGTAYDYSDHMKLYIVDLYKLLSVN